MKFDQKQKYEDFGFEIMGSLKVYTTPTVTAQDVDSDISPGLGEIKAHIKRIARDKLKESIAAGEFDIEIPELDKIARQLHKIIHEYKDQ